MSIMDIPTHKLVCNDCEHEAECTNLISFNSFTPLPKGYSYSNKCPKCGSQKTKRIPIEDKDEFPF